MGPFASAAASLYANGWHPLPLPPGSKAPPPDGTTGGAPDVDAETINRWIEHRPNDNVGLRMATDVIGIDVDNYGTHHGADTLARLIGDHGPLPSTWSTTSRGMGPSRISYYHVPDGVRFPGMLGDGIDVIQHHHRYAVGPPSVHPDTRTIYRWHHEHTSTPKGPHVDDIPALPESWLSLQHRPGDLVAPVRADNINALLGGDTYGDDSIAATIANRESWHYRLAADGWMPVRHNRSNESGWRRPGKATGLSAVLHEPDGPFVVFSSSIPALQHRWAETADGTAWAFSMFGYIAATRYGGDRSRCAREERQHADDNGRATFMHATAATTAALLDAEMVAAETDDAKALWHFARFDDWGADDLDANEWLAWPLIPAGRSVAIHAPAKAGKSIVTLAAVAAMVGGRDLYGRWPLSEPVSVMYVDYEMTEADLFDRLDELGYGPDDTEFHTRLHYAVLPSSPPLDTFEGGTALLAMARNVGARCVILDTFGRAVHGPENDADTVRNFYRYTGATLKAAGITVVRLDHTGKDHERGQRGTSSKNEDVDLVWRLSRTDRGAQLDVTHTRMSNVPRAINLVRVDDTATPGLVKWVSYDEAAYPAGTSALIAECDTLAIATDVSANAAYKAYRDRGGKARRASFLVAHKCRKERFPAVIHKQNGRATNTEAVPPGLPGAIATPEPPTAIPVTDACLSRDRQVSVSKKIDEGQGDGPIEFPY